MRKEFETFRTVIQASKNFVLTTHINPDGDGLGSECALASYLKSAGKNVSIINHSSTPSNYSFLEKSHPILRFDGVQHAPLIAGADVIVILDTNHPSRLAGMEEAVRQSKAKKICIDHHLDPAPFADIYILDEASAATGEILYRLLTFLDASSLSKTVALSLYTAIMTDTGSFRYPKTGPDIHRIIADLIEKGADPVELYEQIYEQGSYNRFKLLGEALAGMKLAHDGRVAYLTITRKMLSETGTAEVDTDAFVPYTMSIRGVQIGLMFTEMPDGVKINFRSKGDIAINKLAKQFGGNGHKNAAGARVHNKSLNDVLPHVVKESQSFLL